MPLLKTIQTTGLKAKPINYNLAPLTIFCAPNGEGKTAIREALTLAVLGYVPELGKLPSATMKLASKDEMTVIATLDSGATSTQVWRNGTPKYSGAPIVTMPAIAASLSTFWAMTGPERSAYVFSLRDPETLGFSEDKIFNAIRSVEAGSPLALKYRDELVEETKLSWFERGDSTLQEWAEITVKEVSTKLAAEEKALKGLVAAKAQAPAGELFGESIPADIEQQLADAREKLDGLKAKHTEHLTKSKGIAETLAKIEKAKNASPIVIPPGGVAEIEKEIEKLTKERDAIALDPKADNEYAKAQQDELLKGRDSAEDQLKVNDIAKEISDIKAESSCRCGRKHTAKTRNFLTAGLEESLSKAKQAATESNKEHESAQLKLSEATAARNANDQRQAKRDDLSDEISGLRDKKTAIESAKARAAIATPNYGDASELTRELDAIESELNKTISLEKDAQDEITRLSDLDQKRIANAQDAKRAQEAQETRWLTEAKVQVLRAVKKALASEYEAINDKVWDSLLETANKFISGIFKPDLKLIFRDGDIGFDRNGSFVTAPTMSGAQRALAYAGIQIALCPESPLKILMLDECSGYFDDVTMPKVLARMETLIAQKVIDQCVFFDWSSKRYESGAGMAKVVNV